MTVKEVWDVAERAIDDMYKKIYGKDLNTAFADLAEEAGCLYVDACQARTAYIAQVLEDSELETYTSSTEKEIYDSFAGWYPTSNVCGQMTMKDFEDYYK
jgi:hypothetical protein